MPLLATYDACSHQKIPNCNKGEEHGKFSLTKYKFSNMPIITKSPQQPGESFEKTDQAFLLKLFWCGGSNNASSQRYRDL